MHQYSQGQFTTQGHKAIPDGNFEEEQGRKGFFGPVSHLIKENPSTRWTEIQGPLRPHLYDFVRLSKNNFKSHIQFNSNITLQWHRLFYNSDVAIHFWKTEKNFDESKKQFIINKDLISFRNADAETLYFCHAGVGQIITEYGLLEFRKGSYIIIPKCVGHTFVNFQDSEFLVVESKSGLYEEPTRGMVGRNAFYDLAAIGKPDLEKWNHLRKSSGAEVLNIQVKRLDEMTVFKYATCVYDTVGWKGDFFPFTLHVDNLMPMLSHRVHLPPSAHTTFVANGFVVCTFLPRPLESDKDALKVPFYHQNIDYDEVLFYHDGNFFSRDNLHAGMATLHPAGFPHGPHPKAVKNIGQKTHTDEYAVMIDTYKPLIIDVAATEVEVADYWNSWNK